MKSLLSRLHAARSLLTSSESAEAMAPTDRLRRVIQRHRQQAPRRPAYASPVDQALEEADKSVEPLYDSRVYLPSLHEGPQR